MLKLLRQVVIRYHQSSHGIVAVIFALAVVPIMGLIGATVEYGTVLQAEARLQAATDSAALAAARQASDGETNQEALKATASQYVNSNADLKAVASVTGTQTTITETTTPSVTVKVTAQVNSVFGDLMGGAFRQVSASSTASVKGSTSTVANYINTTFLLDNSNSMGLGTTLNDMKNMFKLTGCVFACHTAPSAASTATLATKNGIVMRLDSLRTSAKAMVAKAKAINDGKNFNFAVYTMATNLQKVLGTSNNYTNINNAIDSVKLTIAPYSKPESNINSPIRNIANDIPKSGTGTSASDPIQFLVIVTDGVRDVSSGAALCAGIHCTGPIDETVCSSLKKKGVTIIVLYTTYLPIYNDPTNSNSGLNVFYTILVQPFETQIAPALKACATDGYFYEASDGPGIAKAFDAIFKQVAGASSIRLTQ